jgi:hypothetical protein
MEETVPTIEYVELRNKSFPIEKFVFSQEDTLEDIKQRFRCSDEVIAKAIQYDENKDEKHLVELKAMICAEQQQLKRDAEFLTNTSTDQNK